LKRTSSRFKKRKEKLVQQSGFNVPRLKSVRTKLAVEGLWPVVLLEVSVEIVDARELLRLTARHVASEGDRLKNNVIMLRRREKNIRKSD
jgi:hypothetical protein